MNNKKYYKKQEEEDNKIWTSYYSALTDDLIASTYSILIQFEIETILKKLGWTEITKT